MYRTQRSRRLLLTSSCLQFHSQIVMSAETVSEVKGGLEFGQLVHLPSELIFSSINMADLLVSEKCVRPFQHVR